MEVNKRLARDAKKKGICEEWYGRLIDTKGKDELIKMADCKTSYTIKKGEPLFEEGETVNGVFCVKEGVCKMTKLITNRR